ncbi:MAG: putative rRNA maturation factor [Clostridiales bacterium]|jgi:probable rRNA maturation factor|nr:putative rRNA maturation factor [Clostridiales bacterium]MDK2932454.1 putative rRNA maturation factor [Clostridiales bacterium]
MLDKVKLIIENNQQDIVMDEQLQKLIQDAVKAVLEYEDFRQAVEVSVTLVNNDQIKEINKEFRGKDMITDVLSFPILQFDEEQNILKEYNIGDYDYDEDLLLLGDIVISLEKAKTQAKEYGHTFEREVGFLTVHSMFHLLGYDHEKESMAKVMRYKEEQVLKKLSLNRP